MSFAIDGRGRAYVLDQVNRRIQILESGKVVRSIPLPGDTFQDLTIDDNGRPTLLDRFREDAVVFLDATGKSSGQVKLSGLEIPEGGLVTGLFSRSDGTWAEVEHERLVRIADAQGRPEEPRSSVPGRFSLDGRSLLTALREGSHAAVVLARPADDPGRTPDLFARVEFPLPVLQLCALESDRLGRVFLGASLARFEEREPYAVLEEAEVVVILQPDGREAGRVVFPARSMPEEQFRPILVTPDGVIYQLGFTPYGIELRRVAS
jgi:hypothetical protein